MKRHLDERLCLFMKMHPAWVFIQESFLIVNHHYLINHIIYYFSFHGVSALFALGICVRNNFVVSIWFMNWYYLKYIKYENLY